MIYKEIAIKGYGYESWKRSHAAILKHELCCNNVTKSGMSFHMKNIKNYDFCRECGGNVAFIFTLCSRGRVLESRQ